VIDVRRWRLPFRIGTTSYIMPADLLPNAEFLAAHVQDMQLVLFEVPDGPSNLPTPQEVAALAAVGQARELSYTVHLLHDLRLHNKDGARAFALRKAQEVIDLTRPLAPLAWVCHLDGRSVRQEDRTAPAFVRWQQETAMALQQVCDVAGDGRRVAVENLEGYPPDFVTPVVECTAAGRCLDVGHLWLDGIDPLPYLAAALPRLQVVHLHGVRSLPGTADGATGAAGDLAQDSRDHNSLAYADPVQLDAVISALIAAQFVGVLCLEIFGEDDFWSSLTALDASVQRVHLTKGATK
jgi:sugar phosphate isomerase/epimerase